jgi:hypothetical protein
VYKCKVTNFCATRKDNKQSLSSNMLQLTGFLGSQVLNTSPFSNNMLHVTRPYFGNQ